jgi:DNA-binding MarR family transcriptional regulator
MSTKPPQSGAVLGHLLHRAVQLADDLHAERFGPEGLTPRQYAVLSAVSEEEGLSQNRIVAATGVDRSTLAEMLARLAERGLVARIRSPGDARANLVTLTEAGRAVLQAARSRAEEADLALLERLPEDRRARFVKDLRRLVAGPSAGAKTKGKKRKKGDRRRDEALTASDPSAPDS